MYIYTHTQSSLDSKTSVFFSKKGRNARGRMGVGVGTDFTFLGI